jgi:hypothetical protein
MQSISAHHATSEVPASGEAIAEPTSLAREMSTVRMQLEGRSIRITLSTLDTADSSCIVVSELRMPRPDRTLLIIFLLSLGFGVMHRAVYLAGLDPVGYQPTNPESFQQAMRAIVRHRGANRRSATSAAVVMLVLGVAVYLSGTEFFMDWEEGLGGSRNNVQSAALIGGLMAAIAAAVHSSHPNRSWLGSIAHGLAGIVVGASTAWFVCISLGALIGTMFLATVGLLILVVNGPTWSLADMLFEPIAYGGVLGVIPALWGMWSGCQAALKGQPVHKTVFDKTKTMIDDACKR